jgi:hypothetical protein
VYTRLDGEDHPRFEHILVTRVNERVARPRPARDDERIVAVQLRSRLSVDPG